jgi:uncharacterized membrane protein
MFNSKNFNDNFSLDYVLMLIIAIFVSLFPCIAIHGWMLGSLIAIATGLGFTIAISTVYLLTYGCVCICVRVVRWIIHQLCAKDSVHCGYAVQARDNKHWVNNIK